MANFSLALLGPFQAWTASGSQQPFRTSKERALLAYLAVEYGQPHRREVLAQLFWPDRSESIARNNLRQALYGIRQALGEEAFDSLFTVTMDDIQFTVNDHIWFDVAAFDVHLRAVHLHGHERSSACPHCVQHLRDAVEVYRGAFLADFSLEKNYLFQDWVERRREQYFQSQIEALATLIQSFEAGGEFGQAAAYAQRYVQLQPMDEEGVRLSMRLLARAGRHQAALEQYAALQDRFALRGAQPASQTAELAEQIRSGGLGVGHSKDQLHNLPQYLTPFFGREMDLAQIARAFESPSSRLISITGPGGVGKTRLAVQAALSNQGAFIDGLVFVPLETVSTLEGLVAAISEAAGLVTGGQEDLRASLFNYLRHKHALIVLDNFEHLLNAKSFLLELLQAAPFVRMLVTSRERLNFQAEYVIELSGLSFPGRDAPEVGYPVRQGTGRMEGYSAVRLFFDRASRVRPLTFEGYGVEGVELEPGMIESAVRICQVVDGLPLGIELAAGLARDFQLDEIASEIQSSIDFLQTSFEDMPERLRSLRATFEHSWDLLSESEREVFCKLSVFQGSFTAEAAGQVAGAALPWLVQLEAKSLIRRAGYGRFDLHPLLRQFARQKLRQHSRRVEDQALQQHASFFCAFLRISGQDVRGGRQAETLDLVATEIENVRAAWAWAYQHRSTQLLDEAAFGMLLYKESRSLWREGHENFRLAIEAFGAPGSLVEKRTLAYLLACYGWFCTRLTRFDQAEGMLNQSLSLLADVPPGAAHILPYFALGFLKIWQGQFVEAMRYVSTCLQYASQFGDAWATAWGREMLAEMAFESRRTGYSQEPFMETLALFERIGEQRGISRVLNYLGNIAMAQGKTTEARGFYERMLTSMQRIGDVWGAAGAYSKLGKLALLTGDYEHAWKLLQQGLTLVQKTGDLRRAAYAVGEIGEAACALGRIEEAEENFQRALLTAAQTRNMPLALDLLTGISASLIRQGQTNRAEQLLTLVQGSCGVDPITAARVVQMQEAHNLAQQTTLSDEEAQGLVWQAVDDLLKNGIRLSDTRPA